jgi:outer membrane protein assembly factor BamB
VVHKTAGWACGSVVGLLLLGMCAPASSQSPSPNPSASMATWPQWRGPMRDGRIPVDSTGGPAWPQSIAEDKLKQAWSVPLGASYSGPIVSATRVFTTETVDKKREQVRAFDRITGKQLWITGWDGSLSVPFFAKENGDWIRSTPCLDIDATDGTERLFVGGIRDRIVCLNAATGEELWAVDCVERFKSDAPAFGCVCSPLVLGDAVYMQAGGGFVKLDKRTGATLWRVLEDGGGMGGSAFSSPFIAELGGRRQILVQTRNDLVGVDPESGATLWKQKIDAFRGMNIITPTVFDQAIFTSAYGGKAQLWKPTIGESSPGEVSLLWTKKTEGYMSTPVVVDGHAFVHLRSRRVACVNLTTGEESWRTEPFGRYWSFVGRGDQLLALDERGDLYLLAADTKAFTVIGKRKLTEEEAWAHLAVAGDQLFVRDLKTLTAWSWKE